MTLNCAIPRCFLVHLTTGNERKSEDADHDLLEVHIGEADVKKKRGKGEEKIWGKKMKKSR